ncbi:hypothetical protein AN401_07250 [Zobellella denitrificans]|uniref:Phage tail protein n=1 Tax=Zobellella denitrificans TaxID=347534 RepID=A0A291HNJ4_9GAMM|nr:hypothetical protein [Zobellella denitrificans]ATG73679.1 hypothetical protein AN401_07250 [Zobellella denitrificans]
MAALHVADYLAAEGLIVTRLEAQLADVAGLKILRPADLAGVAELAQHTPAVHVLYGGDVVSTPPTVDQGNYQPLRQRWLVVLAVRNATRTGGGQLTGQQVRESAGPLLSQIIAALGGWRPGQGYGPLVRVAAPAPAYRPGGYGYFPLQYETVLLTRASVD